MAMNLEAVLRIAAKVVGLDEVTKLERAIGGAESAAKGAKATFGAVVNSSTWQAAAAAAAGFGVAIGLSVRAAMDFETAMSSVRKVVDGLESPKAFAEIKAEILDLSRVMPITAQGFADIYAAAAQSGIAKAELKEFAILTAQVATAFDMTAADAGKALAQIKVSLGLTTPELRDLGDAMNYVSNNTGATAANLVEFMSRAGAMGKLAGLTGQQTAAFGAAMIQTGVQTEVAATSFNNMIKALSKGPSMTDRQVDALRRLGYSMTSAADEEKRLTAAIQAESDKRIGFYRNETDALLKEISRRYRNQEQQLQDGFEDEAKAFADSLRSRADAQIRAIEASQTLSDAAKRQEIDAINKQLDAELTARRRADRDRQQVIKDRLDDQQEIERKAAEERFKIAEGQEKTRADALKAAAKKTAEETAAVSTQAFAERLQKDAIGTITEVLGKIAALPKSQQVSVLSDLFGDEARGLTPLVANLGELERVLGLVGDKGKYSGSVLDEYQKASETAANKMQLFKNNTVALQIAIGDTLLPALVKLVNALNPVITAVGKFAQANPGITQFLVVVGSIAAGLVIAAPFILSFITLWGKLQVALAGSTALAGLGTTISTALAGVKTAFTSFLAAGLAPKMAAIWGTIKFAIMDFAGSKLALNVAFALGKVAGAVTSFFSGGLMAAIGTGLKVLLGFLAGPAGWILLAAGLAVVIYKFREPIMEFFAWIGGAISTGFSNLMGLLQPIFVQPFIDLWNNVLRGPITAMFTWLGGYIQTSMQNALALAYAVFVLPWLLLWDAVKEPVTAFFGWISNEFEYAMKVLGQLAYAAFIQPWVDLWNNAKAPVTAFFGWISNEFEYAMKVLGQLAYNWFIQPWVDLWNNAFRKPVTDGIDWVQNAWTGISKFFQDNVTTPISDAWDYMAQLLPTTMQRAADFVKGVWVGVIDSIKNAVRNLLQFVVNAINAVSTEINKVLSTVNALAAKFGGPQFNLLPQLSVPGFAQGGVVTGPTLAMVGEGGEPEYIIPESKMQATAQNYLAGQRGAAAIQSTSSSGASAAGGDIQIDITTGPVMQMDSERYVTLADLERAMRMTADGVYASLRTPAGRYAMGTR